MSWLQRGFSYCRQVAGRLTNVQPQHQILSPARPAAGSQPVQIVRSVGTNYKFPAPSPYRKPGPQRHGYKQEVFDGGPLPRGLPDPITSLKRYKPRNAWSEKRALFGRNDYIDILGDTPQTPKDLLHAPGWIRGFNGNEFQRIIQRMKFEKERVRQLYPTFYKQNYKRLRFLYKKYNHKRGKPIVNVVAKNKTY